MLLPHIFGSQCDLQRHSLKDLLTFLFRDSCRQRTSKGATCTHVQAMSGVTLMRDFGNEAYSKVRDMF